METELLIVGSGPAGLMAAYSAASKGHDVTVIERLDSPGGMSASFEINGMRVDYGSHRLHPATSKPLLEILKNILGDDLQTRKRNGRIRVEEKWVTFPLSFSNLVKSLPAKSVSELFKDSLTSPFRQPAEETFAEYIKAGLGPKVFDLVYGPYAKKLWGINAEELHSDLARKRVSAKSHLDILKKLIRSTISNGQNFFYPRNGYGQICERLAEEAENKGARFLFETEIKSIDFTHKEHVTTKTENGSFDSQRVWSTAPFSSLAKMINPSPPPQILESLEQLKYRAMVLVYLICDQERLTEFDAHYFPEIDTPISRISEPKNYREGSDPKNFTIICCEVPCWEGDKIWLASDEELGEMMIDSLAKQGLPKINLLETETRRLPRVYPIYDLDYKERFENLIDWSTSQERLTIFGRQGLFAPDNLHHALSMGHAAATALSSDTSFAHDFWKSSLEEFQTHVVED
ncbi:MAG TPA: FAD-dependent oxidoreductase [Acidimicrobiales bacterium]|nr:FAD-dependent oxidoreductase [Acidimicrobiaceae bacterium]MDP6895295.1 FAD-dependent oxidoreductase [Acidimicrobiales bacterium]HJM37757.1 FAD-dependent oxidoreductase [Acidimicrobiales bacterium]